MARKKPIKNEILNSVGHQIRKEKSPDETPKNVKILEIEIIIP